MTTWDRYVKIARISESNPIAAAVLALHQPVDLGHCEECSRLDGNGMRDTTWPCPTVQAIEAATDRPAEAVEVEELRVSMWQGGEWVKTGDRIDYVPGTVQ